VSKRRSVWLVIGLTVLVYSLFNGHYVSVSLGLSDFFQGLIDRI